MTDESVSDGLTCLITGGLNTTFKKILEYRWIYSGKASLYALAYFSPPFFQSPFLLGQHQKWVTGRAAIPTEFLYLNCSGSLLFQKGFS